MTGLDKVISQIREEPQEVAVRTIVAARGEADQILAVAHREAERGCTDTNRRSHQSVANILEKGQLTADLRKRESIPTGKQRPIGGTIARAKAELKDMDTDTYLEMILKLAIKSVQAGKGELLLSNKDLVRMSRGFEDKLNMTLADKSVALRISNTTRDINGGPVPIYGGIEENRFIDALFDSAHETLQDKVQGIPFS